MYCCGEMIEDYMKGRLELVVLLNSTSRYVTVSVCGLKRLVRRLKVRVNVPCHKVNQDDILQLQGWNIVYSAREKKGKTVSAVEAGFVSSNCCSGFPA